MHETKLERILRTLNKALMDVVSHVAPWLAPVAPAYMVFRAVSHNFDLPVFVAFTVAAVVEATGMMSIDTMTRVKHYRVNKRKSDPEVAGHSWLKWAAAGYMVLVLVVTLFSDIIPDMSKWSILVVLPMVFLLYMVNSVRRQMDGIEQELAQERAQKQAAKRSKRRSTSVRSGTSESGEGVREVSTSSSIEHARRVRELNRTEAQQYRRRVILDTLQRADGQLNVTQLADDLDASRTTVYNDLDALERQEKIIQDGERYIVLSPNGREV